MVVCCISSVIKNWGVIISAQIGKEEPAYYLTGFTNGKETMEIIETVKQETGYKIVVAGGKEYKVIKSEVHPCYIEKFPDAYKNIIPIGE